mmetsp:Transcript_3240/g.9099  ORF Transcript_3240/g.9099 Transcript_3240/m.9099 type:complete len:169 (+) Transcript_3240:153-659(+)
MPPLVAHLSTCPFANPNSSSHRLFELEPRTKLVFGFQKSDDFESASPRLQMGALIHSKRMVAMFDQALGMLGPDTELLAEMLAGLGKRHIQYGVRASFLPYMGKAIITTVKELLQDKAGLWNDEVEEAWNTVFESMSWDIMDAILQEGGVSNSTVDKRGSLSAAVKVR